MEAPITTIEIMINDIEAVKQFVEKVNMYDDDVDVVSNQYLVDGKSILGLFSLDLSKPLKVFIHGSKPEDLIEKIKMYQV